MIADDVRWTKSKGSIILSTMIDHAFKGSTSSATIYPQFRPQIDRIASGLIIVHPELSAYYSLDGTMSC